MTIIYEDRPDDFAAKVEVAAVCVNVRERILLLQLAARKSEAGKWGVPAGKLERGEAPEAGGRRELYEETGIQLDINTPISDLGCLYIRKPDVDYVLHLFSVHLTSQPAVNLCDEHTAYVWAHREEAESLALVEAEREALAIFYKRSDES